MSRRCASCAAPTTASVECATVYVPLAAATALGQWLPFVLSCVCLSRPARATRRRLGESARGGGWTGRAARWLDGWAPTWISVRLGRAGWQRESCRCISETRVFTAPCVLFARAPGSLEGGRGPRGRRENADGPTAPSCRRSPMLLFTILAQENVGCRRWRPRCCGPAALHAASDHARG